MDCGLHLQNYTAINEFGPDWHVASLIFFRVAGGVWEGLSGPRDPGKTSKQVPKQVNKYQQKVNKYQKQSWQNK